MLYWLLFISMLGVFSCTPNEDERLLNADALMESEPNGAFSLLNDIDVLKLSKQDYPYYALLYTQALIKTGVEVDSDSLIQVAYQKYSRGRDDDKNIRSVFYYAMVKYNQGLFYDATRLALASLAMAKEIDNSYWVAKSAELISDIFFHSYNYKEAKYYTQIAIDNYRTSKRLSNLQYALCDLARMNLNLNENEAAYSLLDSIWIATGMEDNPDKNLMIYIRIPLITAKVNCEKYDEISESDIEFLNQAQNGIGIEDAVVLNSRIKQHYQQYSKDEEIDKSLYSDMSISPRIYLLHIAYQNAKKAGDYEGALELADSLLYLQNKVAEKVIQESAISAQRDFYSNEADEKERKSRALIVILVSAVTIFTIVFLLVWHIYRIKRRHHRRELEHSISSILELKSKSDSLAEDYIRLRHEAEDKEATVESLSRELRDRSEMERHHQAELEYLFRERWSALNMMCDEYYNIGETDASKKSVLNNIDKELKKLRSRKSLKEIEDAVDRYMGGAVTTLRKECPVLKEDDIAFLSLVLAGFSVRAICIFTDVTYKFFYVKKSRLAKKISEADFPSKADILDRLQQS